MNRKVSSQEIHMCKYEIPTSNGSKVIEKIKVFRNSNVGQSQGHEVFTDHGVILKGFIS